MNMHVIRFGLALCLLAASANWVPCSAQEDPARKLAQRNLLKNITKAMIKVELGSNAKTDGRISADLLSALIAVKLSQSTKLPPPVTTADNSTGVILAFLETAPSRFSLNVRLLCIKLQVLQPESLVRNPLPADICAEDVTWQTIRFCDEDAILLPTTAATLLGLCMNDLVTALVAENPALAASLNPSAPTALTVATPPGDSGTSPIMQARWIDESCRSHSGTLDVGSEGFVRAVARDFRFELPETGEDGILETLGDENHGWKQLAGQEEASRLVNSGWLVIAGRRSGSSGPGALAVLAASSGGTGAGPLLAYSRSSGNHHSDGRRPLGEAVGELGAALFFGRKISSD